MLQILIKGKALDLYEKENIKFSFQVNDIADVKDRQASYTNTFNIPRTPNNVKIFDGLGITSDTSQIPYQKIKCSMKLDGFDLQRSGWLFVSETTQDYKCYLYSGVISFFKAIENKNMDDVDIDEIDHVKTLENVRDSFSSTKKRPYRYLVSDYNGESHYTNEQGTIINIDPICPSVSVKYLWDKIHRRYGFTYEGEIFKDKAFTNLWLTYPKTTGLFDKKEVDNLRIRKRLTHPKTLSLISFPHRTEENEYYELVESFSENIESKDYIRFKKQGVYSLNLKFTVSKISSDIIFHFCKAPHRVLANEYKPFVIKEFSVFDIFEKYESKDEKKDYLELNIDITVEDIEEYYFIVVDQDITDPPRSGAVNPVDPDKLPWENGAINAFLKIEFYNGSITAFNEEIKQYSVKDFIKEILNRFGLTMFMNDNSNHIIYKTLKERIKAPVIDWTNKYKERTNETYAYNTYAQHNWFRFQYDDRSSTAQDGVIDVRNENLSETKDIWKSKTYAPESFNSNFLIGNYKYRVPILKFFERQEKQNKGITEIEYKPLEKRFYFLKSKPVLKPAYYGSKMSYPEQTIHIPAVYIADFEGMGWQSLINNYYDEFEQIINNTRIHHITLDLGLIDIVTLDFNKLYYFAQEQQFYILNKLTFSDRQAKGEFVRVSQRKSDTPIEDTPSLFANIEWNKINGEPAYGSEDISVTDPNVHVSFSNISENVTKGEWQIRYSEESEWETFDTGSIGKAQLREGSNEIRLKIQSSNGDIAYSNILRALYKAEPCEKCEVSFNRTGFRGDGILEYYDCNRDKQRLVIPRDSNQVFTVWIKSIISMQNVTVKGKSGGYHNG